MREGEYRVIEQESEFRMKVKGSEFIAYSFHVENETEIKEKLDYLKSKYPDARHICYAYYIRTDYSEYNSSDDREPSGSAGRPILGKIRSLELTQTLVAVVRYFGGTLLGVPGLIEAYGESAAECLKVSGSEIRTVMAIYILTCPFGEEKHIYRVCKQFNTLIRPVESFREFSAEIKIPLPDKSQFIEALEPHYKIHIKFVGTE